MEFRSSQLPKAEKLVRRRNKCLKETEVPISTLKRTPDICIARKQVNMLEVVQEQTVLLCGYFYAVYLILWQDIYVLCYNTSSVENS